MKNDKLKNLDPRPKLMLMVSASTFCMLSSNILFIACVLAVIVLSLFIGGADMLFVLRRARMLFALVIFLFVIQTVFAGMGIDGAKPLIVIGKLGFVYIEGMLLAALLSLRLLVIIFAALVLLEGDVRDYLLALVQMKIPYEIAFMVIVGLHFIPILREEASNIYYCMQLRGKDFKKIGIMKKLTAYKSICLPIMVSALRRANEMSIAMELRAFRAKEGRTSMRKLHMRKIDVLMIFVWPVIFIAMFVLFAVL